MGSDTLDQAKQLWDYFFSFAEVEPVDAIVVCCSYDLRVCDYACELIHADISDQLLLSGNTGNWTRFLWQETEAQVFAKRAIENGLKPEQLLLEQSSRNFGENIQYSRQMLPDIHSVLLLSKPHSLLRVKLTAQQYWPEVKIRVAGPQIQFPDDVSNIIGILGVIDEMVGDVDRILKYPAYDYLPEFELPAAVIQAFEDLKKQGFVRHLAPAAGSVEKRS